MGRSTLGLCLLLFASANAFYPLIPEGKELIYHYHGVVRTATHQPSLHAAAFALDGHLHVQTDKNSSFLHFSGLKYKLHNGAYDEWHEFDTKQIALPPELAAFEHPFKIVYEPCGHAWGLVVEADEPQYVVNVKRGIASIMQMYSEKLDWTATAPYSFHTREHTLYGKGPYYYTVFPDAHGEDAWTVKKMAEPRDMKHLYAHTATTSRHSTCDAAFVEPFARDSNQVYHIVHKDGHHVMDFMESNAGVYFSPYAGDGYNFHVYMKQTLHLEKIEAAVAIPTFKAEKFYEGLTYYFADFHEQEHVMNVMNGRRTMDMEQMLVSLEEMLYDTLKYAGEFHLDAKQPDALRGQLVNHMFVLMYYLDEPHLEAMASKLIQKTTDDDKHALHVFYYMLPLTGSHASYSYMLKAIKAKKIKDKLAIEWLQNMPHYVKVPNKVLIEHMSEVMQWGDDVSIEVRKAAILAFGTFVGKAVDRFSLLNHGHHGEEHFSPDYQLADVFPGPKYYIKYVAMLGELMKTSKEHGLRSACISALYNAHIQDGMHYLLPIAQGKLFDDKYLRLLAITSLGSLVGHNEELTYTIFWPIMSNYQLHTNLRVAAYYQIMKTHPKVSRLSNLLWQMLFEPNHGFYQIHYSYLESIVHSTDPCWREFRVAIQKALVVYPRPEQHGLSRHYELDYMDTKYDYGHQFSATLVKVKGESESTLKVRIGRTQYNSKFELYSFLVHVDGMDASIFEDVMLYAKDPNHLLNFDKVLKAYQTIHSNKDVHIDIAVTRFGQAIMHYHYDAKNIKEFSHFLDLFVGDKFNYVRKYFHIMYPMQTTIIIPTEIGFPALLKFQVPLVYFYDVKFSKEVVNNMIIWQSDTHLKHWSHGSIGFNVYNPFIDMFQGVHRFISYEWVQPLYFDLSYNPAQHSMKLSWKRHDDPQKDAYGLKSYAASWTTFIDDKKTGLLQQSCHESKNWHMVTNGAEHRHTHVLYDNDCSNTGYHHTIVHFDSDAYIQNRSVFNYYSYLHDEQHYHTSVGHWLLTRFHAFMQNFIQPYSYANGVLVRSEVSKQYPVTNVDVNIRFTRDYKRGDMLVHPAYKWNMRGTYSVKFKDVTVKTWDANVIFDSDLGHTTNSLKAIFSRLVPGQKEWRMCVDANRKYTEHGIEGEAIVAMTHSNEPKCTKDEKIMEIKLKAEKLPHQLDGQHVYGECQEGMWSDLHGMHSLTCFQARDSFRRWTYDCKSFNIPTEFQKYLRGLFEWTKLKYMKYFTKMGGPSMTLEKGAWHFVHEYPLVGQQVDMHIHTSESDFHFGGIPSHEFLLYDYQMASPHISSVFKLMHRMGWTQICRVHQQHYFNATGSQVSFVMPSEWTLYIGDAAGDAAKHGLWLKKIDNEYIAMRMQHGEHSLEVVPTGRNVYNFFVDGKQLDAHTHQHEERWFWLDAIKETGVVSIFCMHTGSHLVFDGHQLFHEYPNVDLPIYGMCA